MKKLFYVRREVWAPSIEKAMTGKGKIYSIEEAEEAKQIKEKPVTGFNTKKKHEKTY